MKKTILLLGMLTCIFLLSPLANATTLTFDGQAGEVESPYTEKGFTLTAAADDSLFYAYDPSDTDYSGSEALINEYLTATILTTSDSRLFNLSSIDLVEGFNYGDDPADITTINFTAFYADGTSYSLDLTTDGVFGAETFTFGNEFQNLAYVSFGYDEYFQFDNITASPVPEPSTFLLMGFGMTLLAAGRRKKND